MQKLASDLNGMRQAFVRSALIAAVFCINSLVVIAASNYTGGFAALWSANASLVFMLMIFPRNEQPFYCASVFLASLAVNIAADFPMQTAFFYSLSNILEAMLVFHIIVRLGFPKTGLYNPTQLLEFGAVAAFAAAVSATTASLGSVNSFGQAWLSWFASDLLGLLIFLPSFNIIHAIWTGAEKYTWPGNRKFEFAGIMFLVFAVSTIALIQSVVPLLFLTAIPVFMAVFRFGPLGGMASTLIVAIVAEVLTVSGYGPIAGLNASQITKIFVLQTYIASQLMLALPIASLLADQKNKADKIIENEKLLRMMAEKDHRKAEEAKLEKMLLLARDDLTGLASRRHIMEECERALRRSQADGRHFSIAIFDVDKFKTVNDRFGHAVGDEILRLVGKIAAQNIGINHQIGRIGGEEFLVLMPDTSIADAEKQVESLRVNIMNARLNDPAIGVTVSAGLADSSAAQSVKQMLSLADAALYIAKSAGRNRLEIAA